MQYEMKDKAAITKISLGPAKSRYGDEDGERVLEIETSKSYNGGSIETRATVFFCAEYSKQHAFGMGKVTSPKDGDFSMKFQIVPAKRVTEKLVKEAHAKASPLFEAVIAEARHFYAQE